MEMLESLLVVVVVVLVVVVVVPFVKAEIENLSHVSKILRI